MINWLQKKKVAPIHMSPGDTLTLEYHDGITGRYESLRHEITDRATTVDSFAIGYFEEELGFAKGYVGVFGQSKNESEDLAPL